MQTNFPTGLPLHDMMYFNYDTADNFEPVFLFCLHFLQDAWQLLDQYSARKCITVYPAQPISKLVHARDMLIGLYCWKRAGRSLCLAKDKIRCGINKNASYSNPEFLQVYINFLAVGFIVVVILLEMFCLLQCIPKSSRLAKSADFTSKIQQILNFS